jgi:putative transposase
MKRKPYSTDLNDAQWALLEPLIPPARPGGRRRETDMREVVNALFYLNRQGCTWRGLPHDFPPWRTVYNYFAAWQRDGTWDRILDALRPRVRAAAGRHRNPRVACIDSQSVKTAYGGDEVNTDGGKKVRGRKRHIVVDTLGFLLAVVVTAANVDDARAAQELFAQLPSKDYPRLEVVQADNKYHNHELERWLRVHHRGYWVMVVSRPPGERKFIPLKSRWVVERTLAWLGRYRRLSKDYEHTTAASEAMVKIASIQHALNRLHGKRLKRSERFRFKGHRPKSAAA